MPRTSGTGHGIAKTTTTGKAEPPRKRATAPSSARSTDKARARDKGPARPPRGRYTDEVRWAALDVLKEEGLAAAHDATGVPKATLSRWAKAASIDLGELARARTAAATEAVRERAAEAKLTTVELLERKLDAAGTYLAHVAGANADAAAAIAAVDDDLIRVELGVAGPYAVVEDTAAQAASKRALALAGLPLSVRDAEGLVTRAIHDLALLRGEATERGELVVEFAVPRPNPQASDAAAVAEEDLTKE